jgi:hypothetical protein
MNQLRTVLEDIMSWLQDNEPNYANSFLPGLSRAAIQEISDSLEVFFTEEVYTLYQWRNGTHEESNRMNALLVFHFSPLEQMAETYQRMNSDEENEYFLLEDSSPIFPISDDGGDYTAILIPEKPGILQSHIALMDRESAFGYLAFQNCTTMIQTLAESYRVGALYLDEDGFINQNSQQLLTVMQKYNAQGKRI